VISHNIKSAQLLPKMMITSEAVNQQRQTSQNNGLLVFGSEDPTGALVAVDRGCWVHDK
jgi:hypothetical protein